MTRFTGWLRGLHQRYPMTRGAAYATVFLFFLSLIFSAGAYVLAVRNKATITQLCQAGNEFRAEQVGLWDYVIKVSRPPPHETAAQKAQRLATIRAFDAHLHQIFAPRDCQNPASIQH